MKLTLTIEGNEFIVQSESKEPHTYEMLKSALIRKVFEYYENKIKLS